MYGLRDKTPQLQGLLLALTLASHYCTDVLADQELRTTGDPRGPDPRRAKKRTKSPDGAYEQRNMYNSLHPRPNKG